MHKLLWSSFLTGSWLLWSGAAPAAESGLIATGWDSPTAARFRVELPEFEKWGVFDGTTIFPTRKTADGKRGTPIAPSRASIGSGANWPTVWPI